MKSGNAEERSSGLGNQSLGPKDREGVLTTLMCEDKNAARQCIIFELRIYRDVQEFIYCR